MKRKLKKPVKYLVLSGTVFCLLMVGIVFISGSASAEDYTFGSENITDGTTADGANRDAADGSYETITEGDQYTDTNHSGTTENVVYGATGGGSFPSALDTDDGTRRSYTEENTGGSPPASYIVYLYPTGDSSVNWDLVYPSGDHYAQVDETTVDSDDDTTYVRTSTATDIDIFTMADMSDPGAGYTLDVNVFACSRKDSNPGANFQAGIRISSTNYLTININPNNGAYTNDSGTVWTINPATSSEWTYAEVNALLGVITTDDASPNVYCSQLGLKVQVNYSAAANYELDVNIVYSSVETTAQTTGFTVLCQAYRTDASEDFYIQVYNYSLTDWVTKDTIDQASDTDFNFNLLGWAANCERSSGDEVKIRILGATESSDTTQNIVYLDVLKVKRIEQEYLADVDWTATSIPDNGTLTFKVKGMTNDGELWTACLWNYSTSGWDIKFIITTTDNTLETYEIPREHYISSGSCKARLNNTETPDTTVSYFSLDQIVVSRSHEDPVISDFNAQYSHVQLGSAFVFFCTITDSDNDTQSSGYPKVVIDSTPFTLTENDSGDEEWWDGKLFYLSKSDLTSGNHTYHFAADDDYSSEVSSADRYVYVHTNPVISDYGVTPTTGNNGDTFTFFCTITDTDETTGDPPTFVYVNVDTSDYAMTKNNSEDYDWSDGVAYKYEKVMAGGDHDYYFRVQDAYSGVIETSPVGELTVNNVPALSGFGRLPNDPVYNTDDVNFTVTYTDIDGDLPTSIKWREDGGSTQNQTALEVDSLDVDTTDGKDYYYETTLSHGAHNYDWYATDGTGHVTGGTNSVTIQNRDPVISNDLENQEAYRSVYWSHDYDATDPDAGDTLGWELSTNATWLSIGAANGLLEGTTSAIPASFWVQVWCNDTYGGSDTDTFDIAIVNRAPVISSSGNTTQGIGTYMAYHGVANDADSDTILWAFESNATWLTLYGDGWVNGTAEEGIFWCKLWANDSYGGSDLEEWEVTVGAPAANQAPYFTSTPIYDVQNNTFYSYDANATDADPPDVLWYNLSSNCTELSVHHDLGYVNGTPLFVGWYWVNVSVWDQNITGGNLTAYQNYTLWSNNTAPIITSSPDTTGEPGVAYSYQVVTTDVNGDVRKYYINTNASFLFIGLYTGLVEGTPVANGSYWVNVTVSDYYTNITFQNWTLSISEPAPTPPAAQGGLITSIVNEACIMLLMFIAIPVIIYAKIKGVQRGKARKSTKKYPKNQKVA